MYKKKPFLIVFEGVEGCGKSYQSKKLFRFFDNANLYSLLIESFLQKKLSEDKIMSKLVITSNIYHQGVSSTHDEIFRMLNVANKKIIIVGYWVYDFPKFFET